MHGFHIFLFMSNGLKALNWCCLNFKCNINCILKVQKWFTHRKYSPCCLLLFNNTCQSDILWNKKPWSDLYVSYINYPINGYYKAITFSWQLKPLSFQISLTGRKQNNGYRFYIVSLTCPMIFWDYRNSIEWQNA